MVGPVSLTQLTQASTVPFIEWAPKAMTSAWTRCSCQFSALFSWRGDTVKSVAKC